jgi:hypothetical protein
MEKDLVSQGDFGKTAPAKTWPWSERVLIGNLLDMACLFSYRSQRDGGCLLAQSLGPNNVYLHIAENGITVCFR